MLPNTRGNLMLHLSSGTEALIRAKADASRTTPDELLHRILKGDISVPERRRPHTHEGHRTAYRQLPVPQ